MREREMKDKEYSEFCVRSKPAGFFQHTKNDGMMATEMHARESGNHSDWVKEW